MGAARRNQDYLYLLNLSGLLQAYELLSLYGNTEEGD